MHDAYSLVSEHYIGLFDGVEKAHDADAAFIRRHLTGLSGPVLDLGCGPGHWTAYLHSLGADVTGVDVVPEFIAYARTAHPDPAFWLDSMTEVKALEHSLAGILTWYSTIHLPAADQHGATSARMPPMKAASTVVENSRVLIGCP